MTLAGMRVSTLAEAAGPAVEDPDVEPDAVANAVAVEG
jgi:hypothetical protein